jgi:peptidoglycan/LPS O-acetylase OafA/YrhL
LPLLALVPQVFRMIEVFHGGLRQDWYWQTHLHCDGLILGVWLAFVFVDRPELWRRLRVPAMPLALIPIAILVYQNSVLDHPPIVRGTVFLLYAVGYAAWLRLLYDVRWSPSGAAAKLVKATVHGIALASYSIYLVHTLLFTDVRALIDGWPRGVLKSGTILTCAMIGSVAFYFAVERPTIVLRDRVLKH